MLAVNYPHLKSSYPVRLNNQRAANKLTFGEKVIYKGLYLMDEKGNPVPAEFIKLSSPDDVKVVQNMPPDWKNGEMTEGIVKKVTDSGSHFYAIATSGNRDNLSDRIQCISYFITSGSNELNILLLQTKPENMSIDKKNTRKIKYAGRAMMYSLMKYAIDNEYNSITLCSSSTARNFYKNIGLINPNGGRFEADKERMQKIMEDLENSSGITGKPLPEPKKPLWKRIL